MTLVRLLLNFCVLFIAAFHFGSREMSETCGPGLGYAYVHEGQIHHTSLNESFHDSFGQNVTEIATFGAVDMAFLDDNGLNILWLGGSKRDTVETFGQVVEHEMYNLEWSGDFLVLSTSGGPHISFFNGEEFQPFLVYFDFDDEFFDQYPHTYDHAGFDKIYESDGDIWLINLIDDIPCHLAKGHSPRWTIAG